MPTYLERPDSGPGQRLPVIVRGYRNKPGILYYKGTSKNRYELESEDGSASIKVPFVDVYEFDSMLFGDLLACDDNQVKLANVWSSVLPFDPTLTAK